MANSLITPDWITKETARILVNNLKFASNVNRDYDDQYRQAGAKVGYTVKARLPQRFRTTKGQALQVQPITDQYVPVTISDQANVGISFSSASLTMEVDEYRSRYIKPASEQLANTIDYDGLSRVYPDVYQSVGVPGVAISTNLTYLQAGALLSNSAAPADGRIAILDPLATATLSNANANLFNPSSNVVGELPDRASSRGRRWAMAPGTWTRTSPGTRRGRSRRPRRSSTAPTRPARACSRMGGRQARRRCGAVTCSRWRASMPSTRRTTSQRDSSSSSS